MSKYTERLKLALPHVSKRDIDAVVSAYHGVITEDVLAGETAYIHGIGTLTAKPVAPKAINLPHLKGMKAEPRLRLRMNASATIDNKLKHIPIETAK